MDSRVKFVFYFTLHSYVCSVYFLGQNHCIYQYMYFFLLGKITGFLSAKSFLILQIKVRHKVVNRSERVKYMYTCILFVDFIIMIKIQPVGCPIAISLSVRFYLLRALLVFRFPVYHFAQTSTTECLLVGNSQLFG